MRETIFNPALLEHARRKQSFVDTGSMQAAGGAGPAEDPMAGAMPPMPGMGGGEAPPMEGGGGAPMGGGDPGSVSRAEFDALAAKIDQLIASGGAGGEGEKPKKKINVEDEIYQMKKLLVLIAQEAGVPVPPSLMLGDPASDPAVPDAEAAKDPMSAAATQAQSAINPVEPMQAASPALAQMQAAGGGGGGEQKAGSYRPNGEEFDPRGVLKMSNEARALQAMIASAAG